MTDYKNKKNNGLEELSGLFRNESKKGDIYYGGKLSDGTEVVMFRNSYWEEGKNRPYFRLYKRTEEGKQAKAVQD